jgi:hypothetical protein
MLCHWDIYVADGICHYIYSLTAGSGYYSAGCSDPTFPGLEKVQRYLDTPAEEDVLVNGNTKAPRKWLMSRWNK